MATTYKKLDRETDIRSVKTKIHEVIPITGSIVSGTYGGTTVEMNSEPNIRTYAHGMFQSVYDYPYLSSSANHLFDLTLGVWPSGTYGQEGGLATVTGSDDKRNIYQQMAQILVGHDITGNIKPFDHLGAITSSDAQKFHSALFMPFSRLLVKDEIEKESFSMVFGTSSHVDPQQTTQTISDLKASTQFKSNSPAGEYGILYTGSAPASEAAVGLIFYQAGVVVLEVDGGGGGGYVTGLAPHVAAGGDEEEDAMGNGFLSSSIHGLLAVTGAIQSGTIDEFAGEVRRRIQSIEFRNTTELNSTVYFARANANEFNYSSNPTYITSSKIRVKTEKNDAPVSYITTVGLYSADNVLLATAKLSEPLKKSPNTDFTLRVRLDY